MNVAHLRRIFALMLYALASYMFVKAFSS